MTLDELRAARPALGFALYAYTPGGIVTLEVHSKGEVFEFRGETEAEAIAKAFPELAISQAPPSEELASSLQPTQVSGRAKRAAHDKVGGATEMASAFD